MRLTTRHLLRGRGQHRAARPAPVALMRPVEAHDNRLARCPAEGRQTLHALIRGTGLVCWTCRTITPGE
ncbi:hypothetical protein [Streptomyces sp. NPDC057257]|uniref:hypothetical protein n=1 Tax=Streptomyces sp. NPDC057257 TaxID=3346071 RepID=UPI003624B71A